LTLGDAGGATVVKEGDASGEAVALVTGASFVTVGIGAGLPVNIGGASVVTEGDAS